MKKQTSLLVFLAASMLQKAVLIAQTPAFSQFYAMPNTLNPAYLSAVRGVEMSAGYRRQWGRIQEGFVTKAVTLALPTCRAPLAFGLYANDVGEPFFGYRRQEGGVQVGAYGARSKKFSLHLGLQGGIGQHRVDFDRLLFSGQIDPLFGVQGAPSSFFQADGSRVQTFEVGGGVVARGQLGWRNTDLPASIGFAVHHLGGSREVSFLRLDNTQARYVVLHGSVTTPIVGGFSLKDVLYLNWLGRFEWEGALRRSTVGVIAQYTSAQLGLLYQWNRSPVTSRNTHALTVVAGFNFSLGENTQCALQYAFDGTLSGLSQNATSGAHELILIFKFPQSCVFGTPTSRGKTDCYHFAGKGYQPFLN